MVLALTFSTVCPIIIELTVVTRLRGTKLLFFPLTIECSKSAKEAR